MTLRKSAQNVFKLVTRLMETTILVLEKVLLSAGVMSLMIGLRERRIVFGTSVAHLLITVSFDLWGLYWIEG